MLWTLGAVVDLMISCIGLFLFEQWLSVIVVVRCCHCCHSLLSFIVVCSKHSKKSDYYSELEISALQACAASLCCGTVYDPAGLNEDGYIYVWLNKLLATHDEKVSHGHLLHYFGGF